MRATPSLVLGSLASLLLGCSDTTGPSQPLAPLVPVPAPVSQSLLIAPASATLQSGESKRFIATLTANAALSTGPIPITWLSTNEQVASVSPSGVVRGVSGGQAQIVATWGGYRGTALVTVTGPWKKIDGVHPCLLREQHASQPHLTTC